MSVPGATVQVTGDSAFDIDLVNYMIDHTPLAIGFVLITTLIVLTVLLRSLVLPFKAVLMNALSLSAAFGALVWIFDQGHLSSILGFTAGPLDPTIPVLLFCVVFGLSMDYEVFLLTRMQEAWHRTGDNRTAVADGLERSGRLVTGAAAIMACVFLAFALASVVTIKSIGVGMAVAVIVDATLVRALVVPALMRLLGRANWWATPLAAAPRSRTTRRSLPLPDTTLTAAPPRPSLRGWSSSRHRATGDRRRHRPRGDQRRQHRASDLPWRVWRFHRAALRGQRHRIIAGRGRRGHAASGGASTTRPSSSPSPARTHRWSSTSSRGWPSIVLLVAIWVLAVSGVIVATTGVPLPRWVTVVLYIAVAWTVVFFLPALADRIHASGVIVLLIGGALYSAGAVVYAVKWPRLWPRVFGYHEVFHIFVIAATAVYFVFITATVALPR